MFGINYKKFLITLFFAALIISGIKPHDYFTWFLEVAPALIGLLIVFLTYKKFPLTNFLYTFLLFHAIILMIGGHYTYAQMPLFNWLKDTFDLNRNYYDRFGHLLQGLVPALAVREVLIRKNVIQEKAWLSFIIISICLAISACYEFFEWWVALASGSAADAFLCTQGDVWDTQWDMLMALIGALLATAFLSSLHDKYLKTF